MEQCVKKLSNFVLLDLAGLFKNCTFDCSKVNHASDIVCINCFNTNFDFVMIIGLPVNPLVYVKKQTIDIEEQFNYITDEKDSDYDHDEDWKPASEKEKSINQDVVKLKPGISYYFVIKVVVAD